MGKRSVRWFVIGIYLLLGLCANAVAKKVESTSTTTTATAPAAPPADVRIANRTLITLRDTALGEPPAFRAQRAEAIIREVLDGSGDVIVTIEPVLASYMVLMGERRAFLVTPRDLAPADDNVQQAAERAADRLRKVVEESHQARNSRFLLIAAGYSLLATLIGAGLIKGIFFLRRKLLRRLPALAYQQAQALKIGDTAVVETHYLYPLLGRLLTLVCWMLVLLVGYEWLSFVLQCFPYTRPWGEALNQNLLETAVYLFSAIARALPGLVVAVLIFFIARGTTAFFRRLLRRLARPGTISWLTPETLQPTTRLTSIAIWLFALAMAYPYLPGSDTDAFKGLSVLVGLMVSLGASSVVGQAAAGLILTYTRTLRPGEYVQIGDNEGTVTEMGMFTTSILTGQGEVLTIPNSMITGSVTRNFSRTVQGPGYIVDTTVTIGYDTPWRQVEIMLVEAARRTPGVQDDPKPRVFQTALSDFYPEYRLVAQAIPSAPRPRAELLTLLHANIQDVFNEHGVQMLSPHYITDPEARSSPTANTPQGTAQPEEKS